MSGLTDALIPLLLVESRFVACMPPWPHGDSSRFLLFLRSLSLFPMWSPSASQPMRSLLKNSNSAKVHQKTASVFVVVSALTFQLIISQRTAFSTQMPFKMFCYKQVKKKTLGPTENTFAAPITNIMLRKIINLFLFRFNLQT